MLEIITVTLSGFTYAIWQYVYILSVFLYSTVMMVAEVTVHCVSVNRKTVICKYTPFVSGVCTLFFYFIFLLPKPTGLKLRYGMQGPTFIVFVCTEHANNAVLCISKTPVYLQLIHYK